MTPAANDADNPSHGGRRRPGEAGRPVLLGHPTRSCGDRGVGAPDNMNRSSLAGARSAQSAAKQDRATPGRQLVAARGASRRSSSLPRRMVSAPPDSGPILPIRACPTWAYFALSIDSPASRRDRQPRQVRERARHRCRRSLFTNRSRSSAGCDGRSGQREVDLSERPLAAHLRLGRRRCLQQPSSLEARPSARRLRAPV
jgi:hypothetical protein